MLKLVFSVLFVVIATTLAGSPILAEESGRLFLLNDPEAKCLDGSRAGVYVHFPQRRPAGGAKIILHSQGGGLCPTLGACFERSKTDLGSSTKWPTTQGPRSGFLSGNCSINPGFCEFVRIRLNYCDGNLFSSERADPITVGGTQLWFRGAAIRRAALREIAQRFGGEKITDFIVSGDSAGAISSIMHGSDMIDDFKKFLGPENAAHLQRTAVIPLSGFFPANAKNVNGLPLTTEMFKSMLSFCNCTGSANRACLKWARTAGVPSYMCLTAGFGYRFATAPYFLMQSSSDAWQIENSLLGGPGPVPGTLTPHGAKGYKGTNCPLEDAHPSFKTCTRPIKNSTSLIQVEPLIEYQNWFRNLTVLNDTDPRSGFSRKTDGFFLESCYKHVSGLSNQYYTEVVIGGKKMGELAWAWWSADPSQRASSSQFRLVDCARNFVRDKSTGWECNPTCNVHKLELDEHDPAVLVKKYGGNIGPVF